MIAIMEFSFQSDTFNIVGNSPAIQAVFDIAKKAASSDSTILIFGESGQSQPNYQ